MSTDVAVVESSDRGEKERLIYPGPLRGGVLRVHGPPGREEKENDLRL